MKFREEFLTHRNAGQLETDPLNTADYNAFRKGYKELIDNPVSYFKRTCKKYCTIPKEGKLLEAEVLRVSTSVSPDVSIIIPLCNEENRVAGSLENARNQTLKSIEIICVDDGSDDSTLSLIMEQAETDRRLTVLHQGNQGSASAKNKGLEHARGRYVMFLYGGDRLQEDAAERLVLLADQYGLDMVSFNFEPVAEKDSDSEAVYRHEIKVERIMSGTDCFCSAYEQGTYKPFACSALYKREHLTCRKIRFINDIFYEDRVFMFSALTEAERVIHLKENLYFIGESRSLPLKKYFFRVYSYFIIYQAILQRCRSLPFDERLQRYAAKELQAVNVALTDIYCTVNEKELCRSKFTATEHILLDKLIEYRVDS